MAAQKKNSGMKLPSPPASFDKSIKSIQKQVAKGTIKSSFKSKKSK